MVGMMVKMMIVMKMAVGIIGCHAAGPYGLNDGDVC